jgi:hypothetical protein
LRSLLWTGCCIAAWLALAGTLAVFGFMTIGANFDTWFLKYELLAVLILLSLSTWTLTSESRRRDIYFIFEGDPKQCSRSLG